MTNLADYVVLSGGSFEIDTSVSTPTIPNHKRLSLNLPADFTVGTNLARPVLKYIINFRSNTGNVGIWVNPSFPLLQSQRVDTLTWNAGMRGFDHALWTIISGTRFKKGSSNEVVNRPGFPGGSFL
jgi:hypothetical protein